MTYKWYNFAYVYRNMSQGGAFVMRFVIWGGRKGRKDKGKYENSTDSIVFTTREEGFRCKRKSCCTD